MSRIRQQLDEMTEGQADTEQATPAPQMSAIRKRLDERLRDLQSRSGKPSSRLLGKVDERSAEGPERDDELSRSQSETAPEKQTLQEAVSQQKQSNPKPTQQEPAQHSLAGHQQPDTHPKQPADLTRIRNRLDQLAEKLHTAARSAADPIEPQIPAHVDATAEPVPDRTGGAVVGNPGPQRDQRISRPVGETIRADEDDARFRQIAAELNAVRMAMEKISDIGEDSVDPETISNSIRDGYSEIRAMLENHFERVETIARGGREKESQMASFAENLLAMRESVDRLARNSTAEALETRISELGNAVASLAAGGVDTLPEQVKAIEDRLDELTRAVVAVSVNPDDHDDAFHRLEARLSELARKLEEIAADKREQSELHKLSNRFDELSGATGELRDGFTRIESRIDTWQSQMPAEIPGMDEFAERLSELSAKLDQVASNGRIDRADEAALRARFDELSGATGELREGVTRIEGRIDLWQSRQPAEIPGMEELSEQLAELAAKLDQVASRGSLDRSDEAAFEARFDAIEARIEQLVDAVANRDGPIDGSAFGLIENQLAALNERFDNIRDTAGVGKASEGLSTEFLELMRGIAERIDNLGVSANLGSVDTASLSALDEQLSEITSRLDKFGPGGHDLAPVQERLDSIEKQIALARDMAIDVASKAAEEALVRSGGGGADGPVHGSLLEELRNLEMQAREMDQRNLDGFTALNESLERVVARLNTIESGNVVRAGQTVGRTTSNSGQDDFADADEDMVAPHHEHDRPAAPPLRQTKQGGKPAVAPVAESGLKGAKESRSSQSPDPEIETLETDPHADPVELTGDRGEPQESEYEDSPADTASEEDLDDSPARDVEDVPMEPGSGVPDLAALVRHASERRKSGQGPASRDSIADILSDARRAAQAAASEAAMRSVLEEQEAERKKRAARPGLKAILKQNRKVFMAAAAVVAVLAISVPAAFLLLSDNIEVSDVSSPIGADAVATGSDAVAQSDANDTAAASDMAMDSSATKMSQPVIKAPASSAPETAQTTIDVSRFAATTPVTTERSGMPAALAPSESPSVMGTQTPSTGNRGAPMASTNDSGTAPAEIKSMVPEQSATAAPMPPADVGNIAIRQAAANGDGRALYEIARRYTDGEGVERDLAEASKWYELGADAGYAPSQYRFANFLEKGHGGRTSLTGAAEWYEKAANNGNALAMHNLAVLYTSGLIDGSSNMQTAIGWFEKAASLGVKDSQVNLGIIYAQGLGTEVNLTEAYKWFAIAARGGDSDAVGKRDTIASSMRPDQLSAARGAAELWKPDDIDPAANVPEVPPEWKIQAEKNAELVDQELVRRAQQLLTKQGYDPGPPDGLMGERTREAIRTFKRKVGLPDDATVSPELIKLLETDSA